MIEENIVKLPGTLKHATPAHAVLAALDESAFTGFHWKAMLTSGMGFFTDAYDLFIIGVALSILTPIWHLSPLQIGLLGLRITHLYHPGVQQTLLKAPAVAELKGWDEALGGIFVKGVRRYTEIVGGLADVHDFTDFGDEEVGAEC